MPVSGRAVVSSGARHARKNSQDQHHHRRDRTKSSQSYTQRPARDRDSSSQNTPIIQTPIAAGGGGGGTTQAQRPSQSRAHSLPLVPKSQPPGPEDGDMEDTASESDEDEDEDEDEDDEDEEEEIADDPFFQRFDLSHTERAEEGLRFPTASQGSSTDTETPLSPTSTQMRARPDSTAEPFGSPLSPRSPNSWPENSSRLQEINIVVLGSPSVGKSAFIQKAFDLPHPPPTSISSRKMSIDGNVYVIRLIELSYNLLDLDEDNRICWPESVDGAQVPYIDGAFTLYDVMNQDSLVQVPETLSGIYNASVPFILVACKCDFPPANRHVDPNVVEHRAKALIGDITAFQTSQTAPDSQKRCVAVLLRAIVSMRNQHLHLAAARRRANSSAVRRVSPRPPKHSRATSEMSASMIRAAQPQTYQPTSPARLAAKSKSAQHLPSHNNQPTFLDHSSGYTSEDLDRSSSEEDDEEPREPPKPLPPPVEIGFSFDQLVDKLLAQPMSKLDSKFSAIFLALYRKFSAPGHLLDAIIQRFDTLGNERIPHVTKISAQQRHLGILEQWIGLYPGDFAYPSTRKKMEKFVYRISLDRIFAVDAREIAADLEVVAEDDDTDWAFCDRNRERAKYDSGADFAKSLSSLSLGDDSPTLTLRSSGGGSATTSASSSQTILNGVENAQRHAKLLVPNPRFPLTKVQWHSLMEQPDDAIAKELTRMDCILFSSIRPRDLVRYVGLNAEAKKKCRSLENVQRMIDHFNHIAVWVTNFVLLRDKPKHRVLMLEKFMRLAREVRKLNNYNSLGAILAGINNTSVHRLQATKDLINPAISKDFMKLEILMSSQKSHAAYRLAWENTSAERIPYIPLHKRDLVSAAEGNRTFTGVDDKGKEERWVLGSIDPGLRINWKKFEILGEVIISMQRAQGAPYPPFRENEIVRSLVAETEVQKDEEVLYARSVAVEPTGSGPSRRRFQWFPGGY
ncbi:ras GEF [Tothia fuscella]|uniref:Ras GEF n=1 Tax=Tothia fuscella TaxID=1048955 RepID=A0A9P4U156_9PEZI|nr:ras GEF [Tothia fuscella]